MQGNQYWLYFKSNTITFSSWYFLFSLHLSDKLPVFSVPLIEVICHLYNKCSTTKHMANNKVLTQMYILILIIFEETSWYVHSLLVLANKCLQLYVLIWELNVSSYFQTVNGTTSDQVTYIHCRIKGFIKFFNLLLHKALQPNANSLKLLPSADNI